MKAGPFGIILVSALLLTQSGAFALSHHNSIRVEKCDPRSGFRPRAYPAGYVRGYYPGRPYYWVDPYGSRYYQPALVAPAPAAPTLGIDYVNTSPQTAKAVDFGLVARGHLVAEVRDVGSFTTGARIQHEFGLSRNVFPHQYRLAGVRAAVGRIPGWYGVEESAPSARGGVAVSPSTRRTKLRRRTILHALNEPPYVWAPQD